MSEVKEEKNLKTYICCIGDTELASVLTHMEVIKFIRFVFTGTVSTFTRECHYY